MRPEELFQRQVIDLAAFLGWRCAHFRVARTARGWRTPVQGHNGFPDLVLARDGRVLFAELKAGKGKATADQLAWLNAIGDNAYLWTPKDWPAIEAVLR